MPGTSAARSGRFAVIWSFLAFVISVIALALAVLALRDNGSTGHLLGASPGTSPTASQTDPGATTPEPTGSDTSPSGPVSTELPSPGASYTLSQQDVAVTLAGGGTRALDLDQPLVNSDADQTDVTWQSTTSRPTLFFSSPNVAIAKSPNATPDECAQAIRLSPSDREVEVSQDLVICALTNGIGAINEPSRARMARIVVNSISDADSLAITITTWEIPR